MEMLLVNLASVIGEESRAKVLWHLMDGRYHTANELAALVEISPQGMSNHIKKLIEAKLIRSEKHGRYRYYQYDRPEVGYAVEALVNLIPYETSEPEQAINGRITYARTCYNHLAGYLAVVMCESFLIRNFIIQKGKEFELTVLGTQWLIKNGFDLSSLHKLSHKCSKACLDWTERRFHIGGALGNLLLNHFIDNNVFRKKANERTLILTSNGEKALYDLGINISN